MKKRILGIFMAAALLLGVFPTVLPAAAEDIFVLDVPVEASFEDASGVNLTFALNPHLVVTAEEVEGTRAAELDNKMVAVFQKADRLNVGIASNTAFSFSGTLFTVRLTLRVPASQLREDDELYKLIKSKVDEEPAWQTDAVLISGVKDGGVYKREVAVDFSEGTAVLNGTPYEPNTPITAEGAHCLQITDLSGRTRTVQFTLDFTPPEITIAPYDTALSRGPVTVYASVSEGSLNASSHTFTENGRFTFIATDAAGNRTEKEVTITHLYTGITLSLSGAPEEPTLLQGGRLSLDGWLLEAVYKDKTGTVVGKKTVPVTQEMLTYSSETPGRQEAVLHWDGEELRFWITVEPAAVTDMTITALPRKLTYGQGEELNTAGLELTVTYNNGATQKVTTGFTVSGYDKNKVGSQTVTVSYEGKTATFTVTVQSRVPDSITSGTYSVGSGFISKISAGTTVTQLLNGVNEKVYCKVYNGSTEVTGSTRIGTGMEVRLLDGSTVKARVAVVVTGDTNGDGNITVTDMLAVKSHLLKKTTLSGAAGKAADTSGDKAISITDFIQIKAHILGKDKIQPRAC